MSDDTVVTYSKNLGPMSAEEEIWAYRESIRAAKALQVVPEGALKMDVEKAAVGVRFDEGKTRYDLIPADGLEALANVYTKGAVKYADRNWEKGMAWHRVFGSLMRHAWKFWRGESHDPETGCHHMAMVAWNALALFCYDNRKVGEDDRPTV